jgi:DNA-binding FrmR family transcriptional regulator
MARQSKSPVVSGIYLTPELEKELLDRLARIEGHVRGVRKMLADHRDCDDILTQIAGVKAAITQVAIKLLEGHLDSCVSESLRSGDGTIVAGRFKQSLKRVLKQA